MARKGEGVEDGEVAPGGRGRMGDEEGKQKLAACGRR